MNKITEYLTEMKMNLDNLNSRTIVNSKGLPDKEKEEHKLYLSLMLKSIEKLINNIENIQDDKETDVEKLFDKYASYVRQTKHELTQCGISKVLLHQRMEEYFDAKRRGKLSYIRHLYKLSSGNTFWINNRKQRRHILFNKIPEAKRYRQKLKSFSKEEVKKFYIIKYLDELLILNRNRLIKEYVETTNFYHIVDFYYKDFNDNCKKIICYKYNYLLEKLLYNIKYLYSI